MYCSIPDDKIYQKQPIWSQPSTHKLKSWTETVEGYLNEAKKLTTCLFHNRKLAREPYTWFITIYVDVVMQPKAVNDWWKKLPAIFNGKASSHFGCVNRPARTRFTITYCCEAGTPRANSPRPSKNRSPAGKLDGGTKTSRLLRVATGGFYITSPKPRPQARPRAANSSPTSTAGSDCYSSRDLESASMEPSGYFG